MATTAPVSSVIGARLAMPMISNSCLVCLSIAVSLDLFRREVRSLQGRARKAFSSGLDFRVCCAMASRPCLGGSLRIFGNVEADQGARYSPKRTRPVVGEGTLTQRQ